MSTIPRNYKINSEIVDEIQIIHQKQDRYKSPDGKDHIDVFFETENVDFCRGAMKFTIEKYLKRLGKKDSILKEVTKIADYAERWRQYENELNKMYGRESKEAQER